MTYKLSPDLLTEITNILENMTRQILPDKTLDVANKLTQCRKKMMEIRNETLRQIDQLVSNQNFIFSGMTPFEDGMNSHGILFDRLTILLCKKFLTESDHLPITETTAQIRGIIISISKAGLARSPLLAKEATNRIEITPESLGNTLISLQAANILMWLNQDLLYTRDVESTPEFQLREYISFFGTVNRERNLAIQEVDIWFADKFQRAEYE